MSRHTEFVPAGELSVSLPSPHHQYYQFSLQTAVLSVLYGLTTLAEPDDAGHRRGAPRAPPQTGPRLGYWAAAPRPRPLRGDQCHWKWWGSTLLLIQPARVFTYKNPMQIMLNDRDRQRLLFQLKTNRSPHTSRKRRRKSKTPPLWSEWRTGETTRVVAMAGEDPLYCWSSSQHWTDKW